MSETESSISIQDEIEENTASIITCADDITVNGIVGLNADWSSVNPPEDEDDG